MEDKVLFEAVFLKSFKATTNWQKSLQNTFQPSSSICLASNPNFHRHQPLKINRLAFHKVALDENLILPFLSLTGIKRYLFALLSTVWKTSTYLHLSFISGWKIFGWKVFYEPAAWTVCVGIRRVVIEEWGKIISVDKNVRWYFIMRLLFLFILIVLFMFDKVF